VSERSIIRLSFISFGGEGYRGEKMPFTGAAISRNHSFLKA